MSVYINIPIRSLCPTPPEVHCQGSYTEVGGMGQMFRTEEWQKMNNYTYISYSLRFCLWNAKSEPRVKCNAIYSVKSEQQSQAILANRVGTQYKDSFVCSSLSVGRCGIHRVITHTNIRLRNLLFAAWHSECQFCRAALAALRIWAISSLNTIIWLDVLCS
jgi:hypothetical protein